MKEKIKQILSDGVFLLRGVEVTVDRAGTNNDPSNNMATLDVNRLHGTFGKEVVKVHPSFVDVVSGAESEPEVVAEPLPENTGTVDTATEVIEKDNTDDLQQDEPVAVDSVSETVTIPEPIAPSKKSHRKHK